MKFTESQDTKTDNGTTPVLTLQDSSKPPLQAGLHTVYAELVVESGETIPRTPFRNQVPFLVQAPRFSIDPGLIYSVYPSPGAAGAYSATLPHIVFTSKTLPWMRPGPGGDEKKPWMALLVISDQEMKKNGTISSKSIKEIEQLIDDHSESDNPNNVDILTLPIKFFNSIAPTSAELPYLAHIRQVDVSNKANPDVNPKGWFSVVVSKRLPIAQDRYWVFVVSLEGTPPPSGSPFVNLIILHKWLFNNQGPTFEQLVDGLQTRSFRITPTPGNVSTDTEVNANALHNGYLPVNHNWRNGKKMISWYRGPLVPVFTGYPASHDYTDADKALRFDEKTGMFDISYAAAWQLGRLLALQDQGFFSEADKWKNDYVRQLPLNIAKNFLASEDNAPIIIDDIDKLLPMVSVVESDDLLTDFIINSLNINPTT